MTDRERNILAIVNHMIEHKKEMLEIAWTVPASVSVYKAEIATLIKMRDMLTDDTHINKFARVFDIKLR